MNAEKYIDAVKAALDSDVTIADKIAAVAALELPHNAPPLTVLIHGDSQQLESDVSYAEGYDPSHPDEEEVGELVNDVSATIIKKLKRYMSDWDSGNTYQYVFQIKASYGASNNEQGDVEYVDIIKSCPDVKTVAEAVKAARDWQSRLLERVNLYQNQERGHRLLSVKPTYVIYDKNLLEIAAGTLQGDDEFGISTWLNQN